MTAGEGRERDEEREGLRGKKKDGQRHQRESGGKNEINIQKGAKTEELK